MSINIIAGFRSQYFYIIFQRGRKIEATLLWHEP